MGIVPQGVQYAFLRVGVSLCQLPYQLLHFLPLGVAVGRAGIFQHGQGERQEMKELLRELALRYPNVQESMLNALRNDKQYGLWEKE